MDRHVFVAFIRDITPEVNAKRELVDALDQALAGEKIKSDFLRTISHEVRTPLKGLLGTLDILSQTRLTKRQAEHVRNMSVSANALKHHVSNVLEISKLDSGETELEVDIFNLQRLVEVLWRRIAHWLKGGTTKLRLSGLMEKFRTLLEMPKS